MNVTNDFDVVGVTLDSASRWLKGEFHVGDRVADCPQMDTSCCEIAFLNNVGNLASYKPACRATLALWQRGAVAMVAHVVSPVFLAKYERYGAVVTFRDKIIWHGQHLDAVRLIVPPAGWRRWCDKMAKTTHPA